MQEIISENLSNLLNQMKFWHRYFYADLRGDQCF